jgi:hypothetical protein
MLVPLVSVADGARCPYTINSLLIVVAIHGNSRDFDSASVIAINCTLRYTVAT